jgi:hypothetical protein
MRDPEERAGRAGGADRTGGGPRPWIVAEDDGCEDGAGGG